MTRAVILQPMYLPWMGYFGMVETADVFVFYDDVQFVRRSWQRRNKIKVPDGEFTWLTVPVKKNFKQQIDEVQIKETDWQDTHWRSIHHSYANAPYFEAYADDLEAIYNQEWIKLRELNTTITKMMCNLFDIRDTEFRFSSDINPAGAKTDRLINVLTEIGADEYVSGPGAREYMEVEKFDSAGIDLYWHEFDHPEYEQIHGEFVSHLSAIDLLFHCGPDAGDIIREAEADALVAE